MATTYTENGGGAPDGSDKNFTYSFETIETTASDANSEVKVALNGVTQATTKYKVISSPAAIEFNNTSIDSTVQETSGAPKSGVKVRVYRDTKVSSPGDKRHVFQAGSAIKASALNDIYEHALFALDEEREQNIFSEDIEDGAVSRVKIAADAVDGTKIADDSINSEHIFDGSVDLAHLSTNSVDSSKIVDGSIVNADINSSAGIEISKLGGLNSSKIIVGNSSNIPTPVDMSGDVTITNAGVTTIGADAVQIGNISDTETTLTANSDAKIPTSKAVADHVVDVVNSVGGFVIVSDKDDFPTSNPDPEDNTGTVLSITNPNGLTVSSGTSSNGTRKGVSDTVTITGIPTDAGSTLTANYTMLVQTTSTAHTYTFYKFLAKDGDVLNLSNDIDDFANRYRVGTRTANNDSSNDDGDLFFDTGTNKMYVYDGAYDAGGSWGEVTSTGEFKSLTVVPDGATSGSPVFGSNVSFDLRDGSNAASITNRNQLLVVLNGVVQKSNSGSWSSSEEGFYLEGTNGIKFCTAPPADSTIFVTLMGSAVSIPTPGDETVTEAKLNANAPTNDYVLTADSSAGGGFKWAATSAPEGTAVKSTGESGGTKFLREDGDGTCSWQSVPAGVTQENVEDWVGGMVTGNTETGIAVTYDDSDGTLDFVVATPTDITVADESTDTTCFPLFVTAATGDLAPKSGSNLTFNSNTGALGATSFTGDGSALTGVAASSADGCMYKNTLTISNAHTIAATEGAHSVGPITLNNTVTVNGRWVIS